MYGEFYYLVEAYFRTIGKKEAFYEIVIPLVIAICLPLILNITINEEIISSVINLMAIILGFVIASITILLTSDNNNLEKAKEHILSKKIFGKKVTLFRLLLILFFYIAFISLTELIISIGTQYFGYYGKIASFINIFFTLHLLLLSIRNITNLFFIEFK